MGAESAVELQAVLEEGERALDLELHFTDADSNPSDHTAFYKRQRPVLFFYTGGHQDYHRPTDTWEKINADGLRRVTLFAYRVMSRLANQADQLTFVEAPPRPERGGGPYLGIAPDYSAPSVTGVRVRGVQAGSPAAKVGLKEGDIVVRFAGAAISSLEDLMSLIRRRRPGETVELLYLRDGFERRTDATLEPRP
jgi:membrane-associated protease RseP (regulator of RpoE activity)